MTLFEILADLEDNEDLHLGRLLLLMREFSGRDGTGTIDGLTKLAKLDFLLRYPVYLERAVKKRTQATSDLVEVKEHERRSVESAMVRFKYGPWDFRYRRFLNLLIARRLATVTTEHRTFRIGLSPAGLIAANTLAMADATKDLVKRSQLLKRHFDLTATNLKNFVYETFPEIVSLRLGMEISHED